MVVVESFTDIRTPYRHPGRAPDLEAGDYPICTGHVEMSTRLAPGPGLGETSAMSYVNREVSDGVAVLTLNDPDKRNAINLRMNDELSETLDELEADQTVGALVITGTPPAFCAGADLSDLLAEQDPVGMRRIYDGFLRVAHTPLATIAAVNGAAVGAGMNMVLGCDLALAGRTGARFDSRFLQIGLHPGGGHTWRLSHITGRSTTMAMVVFGEVLSAEEAHQVGLVWRVCDDADLLESAHTMAAKAAAQGKELVARTKATILSLDDVTESEQAVTHEIDPQLWSMQQPAFRELVSSLQKKISSKNE
jgi:enoyl-CoA hydratase